MSEPTLPPPKLPPKIPGFVPMPLQQWFNIPSRHTTWLLNDFLPAESLVMVSGPRKRGFKTWFALWLSTILASGRAHQAGTRVHKEEDKNLSELRPGYIFAPREAGSVLFLEEEGTAVGLKERIGKVLMGQLNPDPAKRVPGEAPPPDRVKLSRIEMPGREDWALDFLAADGEPQAAFPLWFMHRPMMKLDNAIRMAALLDACKQVKPRLIVLDALTYMHNAEENDMRGMQAVNDGLAKLRAETGATILYICHTNKEAQRPGTSAGERDIDLDVRGSSVLLDAYEAHFGFRRYEPGKLTLICRYREREEQSFHIRWMIPPKATVAPVTLQMVRTAG